VILLLWYEVTGQEVWSGGFAVNLVAVAALTVLAAWLSHRLIEEPIRRLATRERNAA
jgi:peptidoglycan/LPS O-acetylase OafA/YrhL